MNIVENRPVRDPPGKAAGDSSSRLLPCKTKVEPRDTTTTTLDESLFTIRQGAKVAILGNSDDAEACSTEVSSLSTEKASIDSFLACGNSIGQLSLVSGLSDDSFEEMEDEDDAWWEDQINARIKDDKEEDGTVETNKTSKSSRSKDTKGSRRSKGSGGTEKSGRSSRRKEKSRSNSDKIMHKGSSSSRPARPKVHRSGSGNKKSSDKGSKEPISSRHHHERRDGNHLKKSGDRRSHHHSSSKSSLKGESPHKRKGKEHRSSKSNTYDVDFSPFKLVDDDDDNGEFEHDTAACGHEPQDPEPRKPNKGRRSSMSSTSSASVRRRVDRKWSQGHVPSVSRKAERRSSLQGATKTPLSPPPAPPPTGDQPTTNRRRTFRRTASRSEVDLLGDDDD